MYLTATLYIFFVLSFTAYYIFVWYSYWKWHTKLVMTILFCLWFSIFLPIVAGVYLAEVYIKELEKDSKTE